MMYLLRSDTVDVEIGWDPKRLAFCCLVTQEDGERVKMVETETAQACIDYAQPYLDARISSVWLYRLINDQGTIRLKKPFTRQHEVRGGTSGYAAD